MHDFWSTMIDFKNFEIKINQVFTYVQNHRGIKILNVLKIYLAIFINFNLKFSF
jgi:hypothetical protein